MFRRAMEFVIKYRFTLWDMAVFAIAACLLIFLAGEYEFLADEGIARAEVAQIELGEALVLVLALGSYLFVALRRMRAQAKEVERRIAAERRARQLASQDPLTGLANRRVFDATVAKAVAETPSAERTHGVVLLDLNGFKFINDTFGHPAGDTVLIEVAHRLSSALRESGDHIARLGGDEFGIVATHLRGEEDASNIALRVIDALREPIKAGDSVHQVEVAIGIALFPRDGATPDEIFRCADVALYRAKLDPQSSYHFFGKELDDRVKERSLIEGELRKALAEGAIETLYQPFAELKTGRTVGFGVIPRWVHAELGEIAPERFLPVAETCGLILPLADYLLRQAAGEAARWPDDQVLTFGVSPVLLRAQGFGLRMLAILGSSGLAPSRVEVEITEDVLVRDLELVRGALGDLRKAGVRLALKNFGTGYSNLYHLRSFKIDRIKIDRSFVSALSGEEGDDTILKALLGLGHGLGVKVAAAGIESADQREKLAAEGCDEGQGHLLGGPLTAEEATALVSAEERRRA